MPHQFLQESDMASRVFICVILMTFTAADVASTNTEGHFPLKDCLEDDIDMLSLLDYDTDQTWQNQHELILLFSVALSFVSSKGISYGWREAAVIDQFSAHNTTIDAFDWSFHTYNDSSVPYAKRDTDNLEITAKDVNTVLELKIQYIQRLFNEMSGVRKHAIHVGIVFLNGSNLTQEEIRSVSHKVQQRNTDVKILVVIFGNKLVEEVVLLTDTIVFPDMRLEFFDHHLLMAMCKKCVSKLLPYEHNTGIGMLSCYVLVDSYRKISWADALFDCNKYYNSYLASIETVEEMAFLQRHLYLKMEEDNIDITRIYIGIQRDLSNYAKRFQSVTTPGKYRPLLISHWLPGKPSRGLISADCGVWQFTGNWTNEQNRSNILHNTTSDEDDIVEGWADVNCRSEVTSLALCEVVLPRNIDNVNFTISTPVATESNNPILEKGNFLVYENNIVSVSANLANSTFLQFLREANIHIPIFDCGEDAVVGRFIPYSMVCDFVDHCSNRRDERFCFNPRTILRVNEMYCSFGQKLQSLNHKCDNVKDCRDGSDEENCFDHPCESIRCYDGSCLPPQWINDGVFDCIIDMDNSDCHVTDESSFAILTHNKSCALICNHGTCINESQLNDGINHCTGPEGPLDETIGKLESTNTCTNAVGDFIWAPKCHYIKDRYGGIIGCRDMSHLRDCKDFPCSQGNVKCYNSYCIPQHYLLDGKADCPTGEDEQQFYTGPCTGYFACWNSNIYRHPDVVCNGHSDCPHNDDELDCHTLCPKGFRCIAGTVTFADYNKSVPLDMGSLPALDIRTRYLDLSGVALYEIDTFISANTETLLNLKVLILSKCNISHLFLPAPYHFLKEKLPPYVIQKLDISYNIFETFTNREYNDYYTYINYLNMSYNRQLMIVNNLQYNFLEVLDLSYTGLSYLNNSVFGGLPRLKHVNLSHTVISDFTRQYFLTKLTLQTLDLRSINTKDLHDYYFHGLTISHGLYIDHFEICCPKTQGLVIASHACIAPVNVDSISSCSNLVGLTIQRVLLCTVAALAIIGNIMVIVYRVIWDRSVLKTGYGLFVTNLGISDFIMGVYLLIIVGADYFYRYSYVLYDKTWRNSAVCKFAGFMACLSCEASTFFVFLITLDRFLVMKFPFGQIKFSKFMKTIAVTLSWVASVVLSLVPIVFSFNVFSSNSMCLGLPLTTSHVKGWEYSVGVFIIFNFIMFFVIACGQYAIFRAMSENRISKTATSLSRSRRAQEIVVAKQLSLVVLSNFLVWFPVGLIGLMSLGGYEVSNEVYAWTTVLLLPINSAVNPVLYTIPALIARWEKFKHGDERTSSVSL